MAVLPRALGGHLKDRGRAARTCRVTQKLLDEKATWHRHACEVRRRFLASLEAYRVYEGGRMSRFLEDGVRHLGNGRFSLRAGDAYDEEETRWISVQCSRESGQRKVIRRESLREDRSGDNHPDDFF